MGDFNLLLNCKLDTNSGNPVLKNKSLAKLKSESVWYSENNPLPSGKKNVTHLIRIRFLVSWKKTRLFFRFKHTSRFCQENRCFCIFLYWPLTIHQFFSCQKKNYFSRSECLWKGIMEVENTFVKLYVY